MPNINYYFFMLKILCITPVSHLQGILETMKKYGEVTYIPKIKKKQLQTILKQKKHNCLLVNPNKQGYILNKSILKDSDIKLINTCSTGLDHIDIEYCKINKIKIFSLTNDYKLTKNLTSTSELAFGLMISLLRNIQTASNDVLKYKWDYEPFIGRQIKNLKVGVLGYGRLGKIFCKQLSGFGADIIVIDPFKKNCKYKKLSLKKALPIIDVLVIHIHLNRENEHFINERVIKKMKNDSYIVNTSRGGIVDEHAIIKFLRLGKLKGYACDVLSDELGNIRKSIILKNARNYNIIVTPHVGGMTYEGQKKAYLFAIKKFSKLTF